MQNVNIKELKQIIKKTHNLLNEKNKNVPLMVWGPMGVGKSAGVKQATEELGIGFIDIRLTLRNPVDLRGLPSIDKEKRIAEWLQAGDLPREEVHGKEGIIAIDEINLAQPSVMAAAYQLILDRSIGEYTLPAGWSIVALGNRSEDSNNLTKMPNPLLNRFVHLQVERPDPEEWMGWAIKNGIDSRIIGFIHKMPQHLLEAPKNNEKAFPTPRSWSYASDLLEIGESVDGAVGGGVGSVFKKYSEIYRSIPDIQKILAGEKQPVPKEKELDVLWATVIAIITVAEPKHWSNVFAYTSKFPIEFQVMGIRLLANKSPEWMSVISQSPEFKEFGKKHPDLLKDDE